ERVCGPDSSVDSDTEASIGFDGEYPFIRGIYPTMCRGRLWTMRQYAGFGSAVESNQRYRYLLSKGQAGLSVAFDLPTQIGMDSDHSLALGEVGKVGVAIDSLEDMETLFDGIPLENVPASMNSRRSFLSFSMPTTSFLKKSPNTAPRAVSGRKLWRNALLQRIRAL